MSGCACGHKKPKISERGTYSIYYTPPVGADGYVTYALDFDFFKRGQWAPSQKDSERWFPSSERPETIHDVLLNHFGLKKWKEEFPLQRILTMSPCSLAVARRKKERELNLQQKKMVSDTVGYHVSADDHLE